MLACLLYEIPSRVCFVPAPVAVAPPCVFVAGDAWQAVDLLTDGSGILSLGTGKEGLPEGLE
jgi:hypothetical protein